MLRFLADEDFNGRIVRGLYRRRSDLDLIRVQDVDLSGASDEAIIAWADKNRRVLLTHDGRTMPRHVQTRLSAGSHVQGVLIVDDLASIGVCIEDILLVVECSEEGDWMDQIVYLPFP